MGNREVTFVIEERSERGWKKKEFPFLFIFN